MPLKTIVKVGNISNLSDARYCSGMGVDMLGIAAIPTNSAYLSPDLYHEIRGWITGPSIVAELYGIDKSHSIPEIIEKYAPDYLEMDVKELGILPTDVTLPLILKVSDADELNRISVDKNRIAYIVLEESHLPVSKSLSPDYTVLIALRSASALQTTIDNYPIGGFTLIGSPEVRPGFKDYGDLADVLEQLEVD